MFVTTTDMPKTTKKRTTATKGKQPSKVPATKLQAKRSQVSSQKKVSTHKQKAVTPPTDEESSDDNSPKPHKKRAKPLRDSEEEEVDGDGPDVNPEQVSGGEGDDQQPLSGSDSKVCA